MYDVQYFEGQVHGDSEMQDYDKILGVLVKA